MNASNAVIFEGATADAYETTLSTVDATADRTINLPNQSGTLPVLAAASATAITSTPEELNIVDGGTSASTVTVADADRVVLNDGGTMKQVAVTSLAAYFDDEITAMPNLTSVGTLTALTVDDVVVDGKVITMTGSSGDTFVTTVAANGATSLVTTDASAAAANLTITADGTVGINSTGDMTLDSSGDIILDAAGDTIFLKDAGTTFGSLDNTSGNLIIKSGTTTAATFSGANVTLAGTVGSGAITSTGVIIGTTIEPNGDTAAADNAAIGYTAAEGLILTGQGSTNDVTIKNDADADVLEIPTGTTNVTVVGSITSGSIVLGNTDTDTSNTGNVTLDFSNQNFVLTLTGNTTLVNPSTESVGQSGFIAFIQDGTGSRTITLGTDYETAGGVGITLTTTASATDLVPYVVVAADRILLGQPQKAFS
jgi:hypothetical protein